MKSKNGKYILVACILVCLVVGIYFGHYFLAPRNTFNTVDAPETLLIGRDLPMYTNESKAIVIGHVKSVSDPYLTKEHGLTVQQDAQVDVREVLKGDPMTEVSVSDLGLFFTEGYYAEEGVDSLKGKYALLKPDEDVLLFLGTNSAGQYVVLSGPYGKYLLDKDNNVTSAGDFKMSLADLKDTIQNTLKLPAPKSNPVLPLSQEI